MVRLTIYEENEDSNNNMIEVRKLLEDYGETVILEYSAIQDKYHGIAMIMFITGLIFGFAISYIFYIL